MSKRIINKIDELIRTETNMTSNKFGFRFYVAAVLTSLVTCCILVPLFEPETYIIGFLSSIIMFSLSIFFYLKDKPQ